MNYYNPLDYQFSQFHNRTKNYGELDRQINDTWTRLEDFPVHSYPTGRGGGGSGGGGGSSIPEFNENTGTQEFNENSGGLPEVPGNLT